jgi:predicted lipid-binding transport protein (Tim44 family)
LIFPLGIGLVFWLLHGLFTIIGILLVAALIVFIYRRITLGSTDAAWKSMKGSANQWQQRYNARSQQSQQSQQTPYYQPQQPYYQPPTQSGQPQQPYQSYGQGYQPNQSQTAYPEQMPPMEQ